MDYFAQQLINGLVLGSIYGLIAIGYTMVYGIVGMINFAHGDIFMIGGFIAAFVISQIIAIGGYYASTELSYVLAFTFFIVLMFIRPRGLFTP